MISIAACPRDAAPVLEVFDGVHVARDDYFPGGTKARFAWRLFDETDAREVVYATPAQGGAQVALAVCAAQAGRIAHLFVASSRNDSPATRVARELGARVTSVPMGFLTNVQAKARAYVDADPSRSLVPFGFAFRAAEDDISEAAARLGKFDQVWCAASSGTLARALARAFPTAERHVVRVGREFSPDEVAGATVHVYPRDYAQLGRVRAPFSANENYESKAWEFCRERRARNARVLFWNVTARPEDVLERGVEGRETI